MKSGFQHLLKLSNFGVEWLQSDKGWKPLYNLSNTFSIKRNPYLQI